MSDKEIELLDRFAGIALGALLGNNQLDMKNIDISDLVRVSYCTGISMVEERQKFIPEPEPIIPFKAADLSQTSTISD